MKIFYSWQDDTPKNYNRYFIYECIKEAMKKIRPSYKVDKDYFVVSRDTTDAPGWPGIADKIEERIKEADIYIADLTYNSINTEKKEGRPNSNVLDEVGMAKMAVGPDRIIAVMNISHGLPEILPFNHKHRRWPVDYSLSADTVEPEKVKKDLVDILAMAIKAITDTKGERGKDYYHPFANWENWKNFLGPLLNFEINDSIIRAFHEIRLKIVIPQTIFRLCGLSCIGKTRVLYECFRLGAQEVPPMLTNAVIYSDLNTFTKQDLVKAILELQKRHEKRILVIDNCSKQLHFEFAQMVRSEDSSLSLITVSGDPAERLAETDGEQVTNLLVLHNNDFRDVVSKILDRNFGEKLSVQEKQALIDFSDGLPYVGVLMANNAERPKLHPGNLTQQHIVERLLGNLYSDPQKKVVVMACALFSQFGYIDEMTFQANAIAQNGDICAFDLSGFKTEDHNYRRKQLFRQTCAEMKERGLLAEVGRALSFRLAPLAINMAQEWWETCTPKKFERVMQVLNEAKLTDYFCQQFQYLTYSQHAKEIVGSLCQGIFSSAEVLNSNAGSRLFRSFVNVNAVACADALERAFSKMTTEELLQVRQGRRNLVWALEKLCFRKQTFEKSAKILAAFAISENENIGNNATGQFIQLFHIWLSGTKTDLERRWDVIQYCLDGSEDFRQLGIRAMASALVVGQTHRMGITDEPEDRIGPLDYRPQTYDEVNVYRAKCLKALEQFAMKGEFAEQARAILLEKFYGLCADGSGGLIIPIIESLLTKGLLSKEDVRKRVLLALGSNRVFDSRSIADLQNLLSSLEPINFHDQYLAWVKNPSTEEYYPQKTSGKPPESLENKIAKLAQAFADEVNRWTTIPSEFVSGHISEGYSFGKVIGTIVKKNGGDIHFIIQSLLNSLREIVFDSRNFSIISGVLTGYDSTVVDSTIFHQVLTDKELAAFAFMIARERPLPYQDIEQLVSNIEKEVFPINLFSSFSYGWGLKHLSPQEVLVLVRRVRALGDSGKAVVFFILEEWARKDEESWEAFSELLTDMLLVDSPAILNVIKGSMDFFQWSELCLKILTTGSNKELAERIMDLIFEHSNELEFFYNKEASFYKILSSLEEHYFDVFWGKLSVFLSDPGERGIALFNIKELLGSRIDFTHSGPGILFRGGKQHFRVIMEWAAKQPPENLHWISNMLPVFNDQPVIADDWHPYARAFIDSFGGISSVLSGISARLGTYSWSGSIVPKLESEYKLYQKLLDHPIPIVKEWATAHYKDLANRIKAEGNRDKDGYLGDMMVSGSL